MKLIAILYCSICIFAVNSVEAKGGGSHGGSRGVGTGSKTSSTSVRGHITKNGTYVQPHSRTTPDKNKSNNYTASGNYNPNTGKISK